MFVYVIYLFLSPIVILLIILLSIFNSKIRKNFISGFITRSKAKKYIKQNSSNKDIIIMHAASSGEFEQLKPILRKIDKNKYFIVQTFLSPTIYENECENSLFDISCYHPLDFPWSAFLFLNSFNPKIYLTTRHDTWPHHLVIAKLLGIRCYLINANLYYNSKRFKPIIKSLNKFIFNKFDKILTGSNQLKSTFLEMVPDAKIIITGDSRFDQIYHRVNNQKDNSYLDLFNNKSKYIILGSIDSVDLPIIKNAMDNFRNCKYIIVPHEVDTASIKEIELALNDINMNYMHLSKSKNQDIINYDCIIIDSVGILLELYKYADIAYVGSGFSSGVHSVIEPLAQNCVVCYGPKIDILDEAVEITNLQIGNVINDSKELLNIFKLIENDNLLEIQSKGFEYIHQKLNATEKILKEL